MRRTKDGKWRKSRINWDTLKDGHTRAFKDFGDVDVFRTKVYQAAKARGMKARTEVQKNGSIKVQFYTE